MAQLGAEVCRLDDAIFFAEDSVYFISATFTENRFVILKERFWQFLLTTGARFHRLHLGQGGTSYDILFAK